MVGIKNIDKQTLSGGIVSLSVGASNTPFDVHVELLCDCSPYFDSLFQDRFHRPFSKVYNFPDDDPDAFADFISWAYCGMITVAQPSRTLHFLRMWCLAEKFKTPVLQNNVMSHCKAELDRGVGSLVDSDVVNYAYNNTLQDSPLRRFVVDNWARIATKSDFAKRQKLLPRHFLEDLSLAWLGDKEEPQSSPGRALEPFLVPLPAQPYKARQLPRLGHRRFPSPEVDAESNTPQRASPAQLANRRIKNLSSRRRTSGSPASPDSTTLNGSPPQANDLLSMKDLSREMDEIC